MYAIKLNLIEYAIKSSSYIQKGTWKLTKKPKVSPIPEFVSDLIEK